MKTVVLSFLAIFLLLVIVGISLVGWQIVLGPKARATTAEKFEPTPARLARGDYLVNSVAFCFHCHTEHDLTNPEFPIIEAKKGAGWRMPIPELNHISARNITPDPETGIGNWTDDEIARAIREGVSRDGSALFPVMPYTNFAKMDDEDVKSIVVYLRTIPPVKNKVETRALPGPLEYLVKTMPAPITTPQPSHSSGSDVDRGEYLVTMADCKGCHSIADQGVPIAGMEFGGGNAFDPLEDGKAVVSMNITQDPSGIAHYDEALFMQTLRTGRVPGRVLNHVMPFNFFKNIKEEDLRDIWAFIKSRPPVKHRISNTDPPTLCPVCNQKHGLGELNAKK